jgi:hypothetical protein
MKVVISTMEAIRLVSSTVSRSAISQAAVASNSISK